MSAARGRLPRAAAVGVSLAWAIVLSCGERAVSTGPSAGEPLAPVEPQRLRAEVVWSYPHDPGAFTQGLVWHDGALYESVGQYGSSALRRVRPTTGEVEREAPLPDSRFAEGLAVVGDQLVQLTWRAGEAWYWDLETFERREIRTYRGEGWGLCHDGSRLVRSDGSDRLRFHDPASFAELGEVRVTRGGRPQEGLNELECVEGSVYANVWQADEIVRIDSESGVVTAVVDAAGLLTPGERGMADVLNGIAWDPGKRAFLLTGKYWPKLFEVFFVPS